jgi:putative transposase
VIVKGWHVAVVPTTGQITQFRRDDGARRFAGNWAVAQIKAAFGHGQETGEHDNGVWSHYSLRKRWNTVKAEVAPWWAECSKEAYSNGIADAVTALKNWHDSTTGKRGGPAVRFPKFRKKGKDRVRCTYTTGALRIDGPRHVVLPGVGRVETAENIRPVWRHIRRGSARLLSATVREKAGRWSVSLRLEITAPWQPAPRAGTVGVDVGIGNTLLIVMRPDGAVAQKVPNPRALRASLADLRRANRALARKTEGSPRWHDAKRRLGRVHARVTGIRADTIHKATSHLAKTHGTVVIEGLNVRGHMRGMRSHRKSWTDAAAGEMRRQLTYKTGRYGSELWVADRWYPSSKTCSACGHVNKELALSDRRWECPVCGVEHDRDENAGVNLARLPASQAEAQSGHKTPPVAQPVVKRVNHLGKVAA